MYSFSGIKKSGTAEISGLSSLNEGDEGLFLLLIAHSNHAYKRTKDKIKQEVKKGYERLLKDSPQVGVEVSYDSNYLLGFLINTLADSQTTRQLLSDISQATVGMPFSQFYEGHELVDIIQSIRPRLIELYHNTTFDDWTDWAEK